jgi:hypothetical protein|tara:strand:+ start:1461 stop:1799 length:339 start_codon:yes stop_codon:yes gene_type:complete|mmetsp:Transcript_68/g.243  ORF Transcript_68/g.243 Transcript_68/m.243 type:complete len:113 (+) Transcript_68:31-369(+)
MITTEMAGVLSRASKRLLNKLPQFERFTIQRAACKVKEDIARRRKQLEFELDEVVHIISPGPLDSPQFSTPVSQLKQDFRRGRSIVERARNRYLDKTWGKKKNHPPPVGNSS